MRKFSRIVDSEAFVGYVAIFPALLLATVFFLLPMVSAFVLGFFKWSGLGTAKFVGMANYTYLFSEPLFYKSISATFLFLFITVPLQYVLALALSLYVNQRYPGIGIIRTLCYVPVATSMLVIAIVWKYLYDYDAGLFNVILSSIGLEKHRFIASTSEALFSVSMVVVWASVGFYMIIFLAALQDIPKELYECARLDGASKWQMFRYVTFPMLRQVSFFVIVILIINGFREFITVFAMTEGGPAQSTNLIVYYIWRTAFWFYKLGMATAISNLLFFIILFLTLVNFKLLRFFKED